MYTKAKRNIYKNEMDHYTIHLQQLFSLRQFKIAAQRICVCATSSVLLYKKRGLDPLYSTHSNNIINNCGWKCRDIFYLNIIPFSLYQLYRNNNNYYYYSCCCFFTPLQFSKKNRKLDHRNSPDPPLIVAAIRRVLISIEHEHIPTSARSFHTRYY